MGDVLYILHKKLSGYPQCKASANGTLQGKSSEARLLHSRQGDDEKAGNDHLPYLSPQ